MATALSSGLVDLGLATAESIIASDPLAETRERFARETGCRVTANNLEIPDSVDILVLAVKPQQVEPVLAELRPRLSARHLVISIAAGVRLAKISTASGPAPRLVRVMPNTPCLAGMGASGYCLGPGATPADGELVARMFGAVGRAFEVKEALLDAVTGLSGSGPAFVYAVIEALSDGGVLMGLPRDVATALAAQTVKGAAEMVLCTGKHPGQLKDEVASPGGTTIAGLAALERGALRAALIDAVEAATRRSQELGQS